MENQQSNDLVYVHAGTAVQFHRYQRENSGFDCHMIVDGYTLRGRALGKIVRVGTYIEKWNHQDIEESILRAEAEWNALDVPEITSEEDKDIMNYGVS